MNPTLLQDIREKETGVKILMAGKKTWLFHEDMFDKNQSIITQDDRLIVSFIENNQVYHTEHEINDDVHYMGGRCHYDKYEDTVCIMRDIREKRDKLYWNEIDNTNPRPIIYYQHKVSSTYRAFYRVSSVEDFHKYHFDWVRKYGEEDGEYDTGSTHMNEHNSGTLRINLISHELREQSLRAQQSGLRKLSDNQIFRLFAWLARQLGNDVAGVIHDFVLANPARQ